MKVIWKQNLYRVIVWLAAEIILNCVGLDDLADYSEFVFERNTIDLARNYRVSKTSAKLQFGLELERLISKAI